MSQLHFIDCTRAKLTEFVVLAALVVFLIVSVSAQAQVSEKWISRYHGPFNGGDFAQAIAADSTTGHIYVTGTSLSEISYDYATVAYDSAGNELWVARYQGPRNADHPTAIAVDSTSGNVYVTGYSDGGDTALDYLTVAYDASGNQLWVARYNGPGNGYDLAYAIAVDSRSGNVYVTGSSYGGFPTPKDDFATIAYDSSGNQLWVARYDGPASEDDRGDAIAVDSNSGNIYVTGFSYVTLERYEFATVAYDSGGNQLWVGLPGISGSSYAIAVNSSGC